MTEVRLQRPRLHTGQQEVHNDSARFRVVVAGRRWGKSILGGLLATEAATQGGSVLWVAPVYDQANIGWEAVTRYATAINRAVPCVEVRRSEREVHYPGGGVIRVRSGDVPDRLAGRAYDLAILDEAADLKPDLWAEHVRPTLTDRQGKAIIISTPKGPGWFHDLYLRGGYGSVQSFRYPSSSNPYLPASEIDAARDELPDRIYRQEYLAEFLTDGEVFARLDEAVRPGTRGTHAPVIGVDVGQATDWTVVVVVDPDTGTVLDLDRRQKETYQGLVGGLRVMTTKWSPASVYVEANGVGAGFIDLAREAGVPVTAWHTTHESKRRIVQSLMLAFEQGAIALPVDLPHHAALLAELQAFRVTHTAAGAYTYGAPAGLHDDCVMALAIAWEARREARIDRTPFLIQF